MFVGSAGRALGQSITFNLGPTVNPLVYKLKLSWSEPVGGKLSTNIWNVLQGWIAKNEAVSDGKVENTPTTLQVSIGIRRRFGVPKRVAPWE